MTILSTQGTAASSNQHGATNRGIRRDQKMTKARILYWVSTGLLCLLYVSSAFVYLTQRPAIQDGFVAFGFPAYLVNVLIVAKISAPLAVLTRVSVRLSDLAYAGMFYHLLLAISAHLNAGDGGFVPGLIGMVLLAVSFLSQNVGRKVASPNVPSVFGLTA
jgi:DoxX-like family